MNDPSMCGCAFCKPVMAFGRFPPAVTGPFLSFRGKLPEEPVVWTAEQIAKFNSALAEAFGWKEPSWR